VHAAHLADDVVALYPFGPGLDLAEAGLVDDDVSVRISGRASSLPSRSPRGRSPRFSHGQVVGSTRGPWIAASPETDPPVVVSLR